MDRRKVVGFHSISDRLNLIYAAVQFSAESDMAKFKPQIVVDGSGWHLGFSGGMTQEQMIVLIKAAISHIASFKDPCKAWFAKHGLDENLVTNCIKSSFELQIIIDLDNYLKHGEERPGKHTWSKQFPRLRGVRRVLQARSRPGNPILGMSFGPNNSVEIEGDTSIVIFAEVGTKAGVPIGDLPDIQAKAISAWEDLLKTHGIIV